ncbi:hypothetical protein [Dyadobacter psychrophilus]|uniref:HTH-type transcriptional regulator / antitoxin HigA n=1 Tax=Dyadobacter psychrophilus TaxID=651661 RepID=A0A1T5C143_9BACT|nr:hypothetical protein [Dyadobacter psychrophilus]SKB53348.1 hypothetical protein SAMN05660293_00822 [Dyadobacter psychrophilus]
MKLSTEQEYNEAFRIIDNLIAENFEEDVNKQQKFLEVAKAIQEYEKKMYPLPKLETAVRIKSA